MYGYVYLTTNKLNGKMYIGQHKSLYHDTSYLGSGTHITNSINFHGSQNFTNIILEKCNSKEELDKRELYWIAKTDATNSSKFYNIAIDSNPPHDKASLNLAKIHRSQNNTKKYGDPIGYWHDSKACKKRKETNIKKYGHTEGPLNTKSSRLKAESTMMSRYGVKCPYQIESVRGKALNAIVKKYGSHIVPQAHSDEANLKRKQTDIERYGSVNPFLRKNGDLYKEHMYATNLKRYGSKYGKLQSAESRAKATKNAGRSKSCRYLYKGIEVVGQQNLLSILRKDGYHLSMTTMKKIVYDHIPCSKYPNLSTDIVTTFRYIPPRMKSK